MRRVSFSWRKIGIGGVILLLVVAAGAWMKRDQLRTRYYLRGLSKAEEKDRDVWVERVASLDSAGVPSVLGCLTDNDAKVCNNAALVLSCLFERWTPGDPRTEALAAQLADAFPACSVPGQLSILDLEKGWLEFSRDKAVSPVIIQTGSRLLVQAARSQDASVHSSALALATVLLGKSKAKEAHDACRELATACLHDDHPDNRILALKLAVQPGIDLTTPVVSLLNDPVAEVRRAAMLAVGSVPDAIGEDDLIHWLHDPDAEVTRLCEKALRSRGLREDHLRLARIKSDEDPRIRLQVVHLLPYAADLDPGVWLRSLSHDGSPAVRAAAIRAAAEQTVFDLTDRIEQMAVNDPSPTIRQVARYYLNYQRAHQSLLAQ